MDVIRNACLLSRGQKGGGQKRCHPPRGFFFETAALITLHVSSWFLDPVFLTCVRNPWAPSREERHH